MSSLLLPTELMVLKREAQPSLAGGLPLEFPLFYLYSADIRWVAYCSTPMRSGGELGTRTLKGLLPNGFQDRPTTNYHNSPYYKKGAGRHPLKEAPLPYIYILATEYI